MCFSSKVVFHQRLSSIHHWINLLLLLLIISNGVFHILLSSIEDCHLILCMNKLENAIECFHTIYCSWNSLLANCLIEGVLISKKLFCDGSAQKSTALYRPHWPFWTPWWTFWIFEFLMDTPCGHFWLWKRGCVAGGERVPPGRLPQIYTVRHGVTLKNKLFCILNFIKISFTAFLQSTF